MHVNKRNPYSKESMRAEEWRSRGSKKKEWAHSNNGVHRAERKWKEAAWGVREDDATQKKKGEHLKGWASVRYIEHALGKWRGYIFACDILFRCGTWSETGNYANARLQWYHNLSLSHFICSAHQSLYIQTELHPIQVYGLNIQLIKMNEIRLEKSMPLP